LQVFEDVSGRDLTQFKRWYSQSGTPRLHVAETWADGRYTLMLRQETPPTPDQPQKAPLVIPVAYGLLGRDGTVLAEGLLEVETAEAEFTWELPERPVASLLRGFSAPVILDQPRSAADRAFLLAHDSDPFNRWEASRAQALETLAAMIADAGAAIDADHLAALAAAADDASLDPASRALILALPPVDEVIAYLAGAGQVPDPL